MKAASIATCAVTLHPISLPDMMISDLASCIPNPAQTSKLNWPKRLLTVAQLAQLGTTRLQGLAHRHLPGTHHGGRSQVAIAGAFVGHGVDKDGRLVDLLKHGHIGRCTS